MKQGFSYQSEVIKILSEYGGIEAIDFLECSYDICLLFSHLVEKEKEKKPIKRKGMDTCFACTNEIFYHDNFCPRCGQAIERKGYEWVTCSGEMTGE